MQIHLRTQAPLLALAALLAATSCSTTTREGANVKEKPQAGKAKPIMTNATVSTGGSDQETLNVVFLQLDSNIARWSALKVSGSLPSDAKKYQALQEDIQFRATRYQVDLIQALETGAPPRRQVAALALGFSEPKSLPSDVRDPLRANRVSPIPALLAALNDEVPEVVSNAVYALGIKGDPTIPTAGIIEFLSTSPHKDLRTNAAWTLAELAQKGAPLEGVLPVARRALADKAPAVRSQAAVILAAKLDGEAIISLAGLIRDEINLPALAAVRGLAYMGSKDIKLKGKVARALVDAMDQTRPEVRSSILANLVQLSSLNYGPKATEEWKRWANNIP